MPNTMTKITNMMRERDPFNMPMTEYDLSVLAEPAGGSAMSESSFATGVSDASTFWVDA